MNCTFDPHSFFSPVLFRKVKRTLSSRFVPSRLLMAAASSSPVISPLNSSSDEEEETVRSPSKVRTGYTCVQIVKVDLFCKHAESMPSIFYAHVGKSSSTDLCGRSEQSCTVCQWNSFRHSWCQFRMSDTSFTTVLILIDLHVDSSLQI